MFIRKRTTKTKGHGATVHYQVLESYRDNGKVKQRVLCNLGNHSTCEARLEELQVSLSQTEGWINRWNNPVGWKMHRQQKNKLESLNHDHQLLYDEIIKVQNVMSEMLSRYDTYDTTSNATKVPPDTPL